MEGKACDMLCELDQLFHLFFGVGVVAVTGKIWLTFRISSLTLL